MVAPREISVLVIPGDFSFWSQLAAVPALDPPAALLLLLPLVEHPAASSATTEAMARPRSTGVRSDVMRRLLVFCVAPRSGRQQAVRRGHGQDRAPRPRGSGP